MIPVENVNYFVMLVLIKHNVRSVLVLLSIICRIMIVYLSNVKIVLLVLINNAKNAISDSFYSQKIMHAIKNVQTNIMAIIKPVLVINVWRIVCSVLILHSVIYVPMDTILLAPYAWIKGISNMAHSLTCLALLAN